MTVHLFGAVSSPACATYALQHTADDNEDNYGTEVANTLRRNFYVDDVLKSASTEDKTIELAKDVKAVCGNGGFNLTKFVGNTERIINSIPDEHRAKNVKNLTHGCREEIRSLVYLLSEQSSPHRGGRFFGNRFVHKCAETFHL